MLKTEEKNTLNKHNQSADAGIPAADRIISFEELSCHTIDRLIGLSRNYPYLLSCYSPGYLLMWREYFNPSFAVAGDCVIIKVRISGREKFFFPYRCGEGGDIDAALAAIERYAAKNSIPLSFFVVPREELPVVALRYNSFTATANRNASDYIYLAEEMRSFAGRKFSGQRNHINKFLKLYPDARFRRMSDTSEDNEKLSAFWSRFEADFKKGGLFSARIELKKAKEVLALPCTASDFKACVELGENIISFCYGEIVGDMLIIHIEKAFDNYPGVYQFMVNSFAAEYGRGVKYINREDDAGSRGLRISKTQYHPVKIEENIAVELHTELASLKKHPHTESERLTLELISERDIPAYNRLCLDDELNKYWGYDYRRDLRGELTEDYFYRDAMTGYSTKVSLSMAIRLNGEFIGEAVINEFDYRGGANIGIRLLPGFSGRGLGREAFAAACDYAIYTVGLRALTAYCYRENIPSYKMLKALMSLEGEDEKYYYFKKTV